MTSLVKLQFLNLTLNFGWISLIIFLCGTIIGYCFLSKKVEERTNLEGGSLYMVQILVSLLIGFLVCLISAINR